MKQDIQDFLTDGSLSLPLAEHYLNIYVGHSSWEDHIKKLYAKIDRDPLLLRKMVACAVVLTAQEKLVADPPHRLLFGIRSFDQFNEKDWVKELQAIVERDQKIERCRMQAFSLGIIDPIDFAPNTRQAFNWLYLKAEESGVVAPENKEDIVRRFKNLVLAYGGAVICNIFTRHDDELKKVTNWRSGYFFERIIYDVYQPEQIFKIKKRELEQTSEKLVKKIRVEGQ